MRKIKTKNKMSKYCGLVLALSIAALIFTVTSKASAQSAITPEDILEKLSTRIDDLNPYFDRMYFSDEFKSQVIQGEYGATPEEFDLCMRQKAQASLDDLQMSIEFNQISDFNSKIVFTNKKVINDDYERLDYNIVVSYYDYQQETDTNHDFSYFIRRNGEWYIDLMPEYLEKKNTGEPMGLCDKEQIRMIHIARTAGFTLARNASITIRNMTVVYNGEDISVSDFNGKFLVELSRGGRKYEIRLPSPSQEDEEMFITDNYDWDPLRNSLGIAQKVADILFANSTRYVDQFGDYKFDLISDETGIWKSEAYIEINPGEEMFYDRMKEVYLVIDTNSGTVSEDQQQQKIIDQKTEEGKNNIFKRKVAVYISSALEASLNMIIFLLITLMIAFIVRYVLKVTFRKRSAILTLIIISLIWFTSAFIASSKIVVRIMELAPNVFSWPFGILIGGMVIRYAAFSIAIIAISIISYRFLRKSEVVRLLAIGLIIAYFFAQFLLIIPLNNLISKLT